MLAAIVTRLNGIPNLTRPVEVRLNIREIIAEESGGPRIWVVEPRGTGRPNVALGGSVIQDREARFGVLTLVNSAADASEAELQDASQTLRDAVYDCLLGYRPSERYAPIQYVRDGLAWSADADLYWLDEFRTTHQLSSV